MPCLCETEAGGDLLLSPNCIGGIWLFENLAPEELKALVQHAARKRWSKGQFIFHQGSQADQMFLIKGGRLKLTKILDDGNEITLDMRKAGDFIGEHMLAEETLYPVSAQCLEDTLTCGFSQTRFEKLILQYPNIGLQIVKNLSKRISSLTSRVGSLAVTNIEDRLYRVLVTVAQEHGTKSRQGLMIQFPLTHEDLSFLTGAHRVSVSWAMKALKQAGKIIIHERRLILPLSG